MVTGKITFQPPVEILIEQDSQSGRLKDFVFKFFEQSDHLLTPDTWKSFQKIIDGITGFQVIKQTPNGNACADKDRRAVTDVWIGLVDRTFLHKRSLQAQWRSLKLSIRVQTSGVMGPTASTLVVSPRQAAGFQSSVFNFSVGLGINQIRKHLFSCHTHGRLLP